MAPMRVTQLDELLVKIISESDHPEIVSVERVPTKGRPNNHTRLVVRFASGATAVIMVREVQRPGVSRHTEYELPAEVV